jgi:hypothetical protein
MNGEFAFCDTLPKPAPLDRPRSRHPDPEPDDELLEESPISRLDPWHASVLYRTIAGHFSEATKETPSEWCCRKLIFDEPENRGDFNLTGREYIREPLDAIADPTVTDLVDCFGSQSGKTAMIMGAGAWIIENDPSRIFWVMPTRDNLLRFSRTRWQRMLKASPDLARLIPAGAERYGFSTLLQILGPSIVDFAWSNSPAALAGTPARIVFLDEVDKFPKGGAEADPVELADQRTKNMTAPKKLKSSTPSLSSGLIWRELGKTDIRRRFLPCFHCRKRVVLAWSREMTVFPFRGDEAFVRWDKEAKRNDGSWDLDRVEASARAECPHCGGHILDGQKTALDREGIWTSTQRAARGFRGYHLPSLYAAGPQTTFGKLAVKFLQLKFSLEGLQGFVNGDLAEPWLNQDERSSERIEIIVPRDAPEIQDGVKIMTVDRQLLAPNFWFTIRTWRNHSRLVDQGSLDTWEEIRAKQLEHSVRDALVGIDSGFNATDTYTNCLRFGALKARKHKVPAWSGWWPLKGSPGRQAWPDAKGIARPYGLADAAIAQKNIYLPLLMFSPDALKDILEALRSGKTGYRWEETDAADEEYFMHQDAEVKRAVRNPRSRRLTVTWAKRTDDWPDHLRDCNVMQVAMALFHGLMAPTIDPQKRRDQEAAAKR